MKKFSNKLFIGTFIGILASTQMQAVCAKRKIPQKKVTLDPICSNMTLTNQKSVVTVCLKVTDGTIPAPTSTFLSAIANTSKKVVSQANAIAAKSNSKAPAPNSKPKVIPEKDVLDVADVDNDVTPPTLNPPKDPYPVLDEYSQSITPSQPQSSTASMTQPPQNPNLYPPAFL
jgi:hypothetical protein